MHSSKEQSMKTMICLQSILMLCIFVGEIHSQEVKSLAQQNEVLFRQLQQVHNLTEKQMSAIRAIFAKSGYMGQGNPAITKHPMTSEQCEENLKHESIPYGSPNFEKICGAPYMAPLYDPENEKSEDSHTCIDQFEFPDIPCEYPVVWVRTREAVEICEAMGKRLCDAHEWEGACEGALTTPDYRFDLASGKNPAEAIRLMADAHNRKHSPDKSWSYGPAYTKGICGASSTKTNGCTGGSWSGCGSNTYPSGSFPQCHSPLMVYDLNGNAAEHMNLPLNENQMASLGSHEYGYTEMKGSWFIFDSYKAHEDWCRWRAPYWHGSRVMDKESHHNYHLGFRCCKTLDKEDILSESE